MSKTSFETTMTTDLSEFLPSIQDLDSMRQDRDIKKQHLSVSVGYKKSSGWEQAIRQHAMGPDKRFMALVIFEFHDREGYLPVVGVR